MSNLVSGITKVFTSLGSGVAKLGSAVRAVGASLFTASSATGGTAGLGGLLGGGGILSNMLGGALRTGLIGGVMGSLTGEGFGTGFKQGAILGGISGGVEGLFQPQGFVPAVSGTTGAAGASSTVPSSANVPTSGYGSDAWSRAMTGGTPALVAANTPSGAAPSGVSAATTPGGGLFGGGFGQFLSSEAGAGLIGGIGEALGREREIEALQEMKEADRQFLRDQEQRITDSYSVPDTALPQLGYGASAAYDAATGAVKRPTPTQAFGAYGREAWQYNPNTGMIEAARV